MPILDNCCFCFSVKTGCFIIGYYNLVVCIFGELAGIGMAIYGGVMKSRVVPHVKGAIQAENLGNMLIVVGLVLIVVLAIGLTISTLFVVGLHKNKRGYVKVFLVCMILSLVSGSLAALGSLVTLNLGNIITSWVSLAFQVYLYMVVKSHYDTMNDTPAAVVTAEKPEYQPTYNKSAMA